ncbi:uncharacterized protein MKK02DRAFT_37216 [Dioszegia hungarica]|uniref:RNI-like protein n=1 Tax=Dioszegia hungarica TaxID=4972 RepID=A0AA38LWR4_9TREE|nr:uncharacterized protein MKK02DRAFT_37216 [Dioszegia hungarica]KAI9636616.1 hypothetical protein MKK02DRAFT_37216 [Dioszegia hungarica]
MAVVLRSTSDLVYLPDHGFVGEEGALRILAKVNRQIRRLDVSHNLLGSEGTLVLMQGLNSLRHQYSTSDLGLWGLTEINLGHNGITDSVVDVILGYAKKDVMMRKVQLQGNRIELRENLDSILYCLNASQLESLSLTDNRRLLDKSIIRLFDSLSTPHLNELHLSICNLGPEISPSIISYLTSPRSRYLELLGLNGNRLGLEAVRNLINTLERGNFTILNLGLFASSSASDAAHHEEEDGVEAVQPREKRREERQLGQETARIPRLLERNRLLTQRVEAAALRCLPCARILLNAKSPSDIDTAQRAIESISLKTHTPYFRLLDLPPEVIYLIVRHTSGDAAALSDAQFTRLRKDAEGNEGLARAIRRRRSKAEAWKVDRTGLGMAEMQLRDDWLYWGKWDRWECDVLAQPGPAVDSEE